MNSTQFKHVLLFALLPLFQNCSFKEDAQNFPSLAPLSESSPEKRVEKEKEDQAIWLSAHPDTSSTEIELDLTKGEFLRISVKDFEKRGEILKEQSVLLDTLNEANYLNGNQTEFEAKTRFHFYQCTGLVRLRDPERSMEKVPFKRFKDFLIFSDSPYKDVRGQDLETLREFVGEDGSYYILIATSELKELFQRESIELRLSLPPSQWSLGFINLRGRMEVRSYVIKNKVAMIINDFFSCEAAYAIYKKRHDPLVCFLTQNSIRQIPLQSIEADHYIKYQTRLIVNPQGECKGYLSVIDYADFNRELERQILTPTSRPVEIDQSLWAKLEVSIGSFQDFDEISEK